MKKQLVLFCDFDGTITENDNIIAIMKQFAPPEWEALKDDILAERLSVQEGVGKMFSLLPSALKDEIVDFLLSTARLREGFREFVAFTKEKGIPLYIVSGGIDFFVYPMLDGLIDKERIFCNGSDFSSEMIRITWPHACDGKCQNGCGCCKPSLLRKLARPDGYHVVIGDSITDLAVAKQADYVLARDFLLKKCQELDLPHAPFTTFFDVVDHLQRLEVIA
ncbi:MULTISPECIES: 2-hydroxy-3-keto-5-methylthiopentenyl-1-phosphate phosphatase [Geobacillus]|jgi:2-hydroxy-3-keto-5-methylthiopentenyl-1-phosphate phosphatase|uniref:2-hydroxy-3-keto-5-methylthiopentenyl-1-phosphate phosphatase n=2 Tax=Geobacillus thermodenitrificans TaxID=33940 RepID=MTNX_GEOTN|nr:MULTISPECIES: 2-hydroxy-3-keto-5-methylthiopentenyl-1-phosphate phosphatase [Geobacillus]A4ILL6.1 RecName: Full=2-hydroxy-3-keto-5-methylthiopentenyl-1-phosphate phosphatase; Short=HK-MTPenyl-1-P phosphatase [Geobacillus thermodenitrificans NG80-2]ABO66220.1 Hydrolase, haloacid dehalogenase-like family [Geobacillus thermodenitrificans NG80-2]ARA97376.1 2-hydroxy-3-keto-5-methylthiopentenyl-1-phosphate phosphatase [Geobacillus thermodenitrificans]ARP41950.1 2-hydroxy-3-keto-5-methylthiopenten